MSLKQFTSSASWIGAAWAGSMVLLAGCGGTNLKCGDGTNEQNGVCVVTPVEPPSALESSITYFPQVAELISQGFWRS
jgi:hypothetical protein